MSEHDDTCPNLVRASLLEAENARLKAEVERRTAQYNGIIDTQLKVIYELKAEVERLDTLCRQLGKQHSDISCENIMLRKAGDAMKFDCLDYLRELEKRPFWFPLLSELEVNHKSVQRWNAAKEGKQP